MGSLFRLLRPALALLLISSLMLASAITVAAQDDQDNEDNQNQNGEQVTLNDLLNSPDDYVDQTVSVNGTVEDFISSRSFTLTSDNADGSILVAGAPDVFPNNLYNDSLVQVTGTVRMVDPDDQSEFDPSELGLNFSDDELSQFEDEPIIVAETINTDTDAGTSGNRTPVGDIANDPAAFAGQQVSVTSEIGDILDPLSFTLEAGDSGNDILVVGASDSMPNYMAADAIVRVQGDVVIFDTEDEDLFRDAGIDADPSDSVYSPYDGRPAIIASSVKLVAPELGEQIDDILENSDEWMGQTVTVLGRVNESGTAQGFTYEGTDGFLGLTSEDLLVIGASDTMAVDGIVQDAIVQVTGVVQEFDPVAEFEVNGDTFTLEDDDNDFYSDFEGDPAIVASNVKVLATETGDTIEDILNDEDTFVGETVTVAGQIASSETSQAFSLEGTDGMFGLTGENLLVIGASDVMGAGGITEEAIVVVTGTVEIFNTGDTYEVNGDEIDVNTEDDALDDFDGDPVLVAETVNIVTVD